MFASARTGLSAPNNIVRLLHREVTRVIAVPEMRERLATVGFEPVMSKPEEFGTQIRIEIERWDSLIRAANIKAP